MAIGTGGIGSFGIGSPPGAPEATTAADPILALQNNLTQCPWIEFYDLTTPAGTVYFVDYAEPHDGATLPSLVAFNGQEYRSLRVARGPIDETPDGHRSEVALDILDPDDVIPALLRTYTGLPDETLTIRIIPVDFLDQPGLAITRTFRVIDSSVRTNPNSTTIRAGLADVLGFISPRFKFSSRRCFNDYPERFDVFNNWCIYPSDLIRVQTAQDLMPDTPVAAEVERQFGWFLRNSDESSGWRHGSLTIAGYPAEERWGQGSNNGVNAPWLNASEDGPFAYKKVPIGETGFWTHIEQPAGGQSAVDWFGGLLIYDSATPNNWVAWGLAENGATEYRRFRSTTSDVSTTNQTANTANHEQFWIHRDAAGAFKAYSRVDELSAWTDSGFGASPSMTGDLHCGFFVSTDTMPSPPELVELRFRWMIFTHGGFPTCDRTYADCQARKNEIQFNGFRGMPVG